MKKKYIIALEDRNVWTCGLPAKTLLLSDVSIFGTDLASVNTGIELTPYTEPDLEQVRKEAYEKGRKDGKIEGQAEGWECARKIASDNTGLKYSIFGQHFTVEILNTHSAQEALEEIRAHEQAQKEKEEKEEKVSATAVEVMRQYLDMFCTHTISCEGCPLHTPDFTCGRGYHFLCKNQVSDEEVRRAYTTVLQKMKEKS